MAEEIRAMQVPFRIDPTGRVGWVEGDHPVMAQYLHALIMTKIGERVMRPRYGSMVSESLFEPIDEGYLGELEADIRDAITAWEPDCRLHMVDIEWNQQSRLDLEVSFSVRSTITEQPVRFSVAIDVGGGVAEEEQQS